MADITMPKMGFDMEQGTIVRWLKNVGDKIDKGQAIAEIETDKVTIEIESFASGTLTKIVAEEGAVVPVGDVIAELDGPSGAAAATPSSDGATQAPSSDAATAPATEAAGIRASRGGEGGEATSDVARQTTSAASDNAGSAPAGEQPKPATGNGERVFASPMARRLAGEAGLEIAEIKGSGPGGRIVRRDVESFAQQPRSAAPAAQAAAPAPATTPAPAAAPAAQPTAAGGERREPLSRLRQTIARRLSQAKREVPHYYVTVAIDMTAAMELRKQLNSMEGVKISVNDMVVKACALALKQFPTLNASFGEDSLIMHDQINVSIAIATDNGLLAPAITDVDKKSLGVLASETRELAERTRSGKATPDELSRGTFTVSNLGMFGVESFVAIINPPQAAIVAVGAATETPVVKDGQVAIAPIMKATISADHRVSDGVVGAQYLQAVKALLETPMRLLI